MISVGEFAQMAMLRLGSAKIILENARTLQLNDEAQRALSLVEAEIDTVFDLAKRASAGAQGMPDADVD
jgi:hypothetical protein